MPVETKKQVLSFLDSLKTNQKGHLYNKIMDHLEKNKDPFTDESKTVRVHASKEESTCTACEG